MTGAVNDLNNYLIDGRLRHCGSDLLAWCVSNAKVELRGNGILITKQASGKAKIDPLMALIDAAQVMGANPGPATAYSIYEKQDLLVI